MPDLKTTFHALADDHRLLILNELRQRGETCVCDLCGLFDIPQSKLSYHLKILLEAALVQRTTRGTWSYYRLDERALATIQSGLQELLAT